MTVVDDRPVDAAKAPPGGGLVLDVRGHASNVPFARNWSRDMLSDLEPSLAGDAVQLVSELVVISIFNARDDADRMIRVELGVRSSLVTVRVTGYMGAAEAEWSEEESTSLGYGLMIVNALATGWGDDMSGTRHRLWAEIARKSKGKK